ncbi:MAG: hypothetical protein SFU98_16515 [Leptospiraceae bacterium]|nr:hypothetical protein [Leptospiraceae bacterium]
MQNLSLLTIFFILNCSSFFKSTREFQFENETNRLILVRREFGDKLDSDDYKTFRSHFLILENDPNQKKATSVDFVILNYESEFIDKIKRIFSKSNFKKYAIQMEQKTGTFTFSKNSAKINFTSLDRRNFSDDDFDFCIKNLQENRIQFPISETIQLIGDEEFFIQISQSLRVDEKNYFWKLKKNDLLQITDQEFITEGLSYTSSQIPWHEILFLPHKSKSAKLIFDDPTLTAYYSFLIKSELEKNNSQENKNKLPIIIMKKNSEY